MVFLWLVAIFIFVNDQQQQQKLIIMKYLKSERQQQ